MIDRDLYRREDKSSQPASLFAPYKSTRLRSPSQALVQIPQSLTETTGAEAWNSLGDMGSADLNRQHSDQPIGQRIIVAGRVLDEYGRPVPKTLIEIWQANSAGRYIHTRDQWDAPIDPNFTGAGAVVTDDEGAYSFTSVRPGAYPWGNHDNAWRPAHIHFSLFGPAFVTRLVTQMYFEGDPLISRDPIAQAVPEAARQRLVARFDPDLTQPHWALGYVFDIVLRGRTQTPMEA